MSEAATTLPHAPGSDTSRDAAESAATHAAQDRARILAFYARRGEYGATADEVLANLTFAHQTAAARVSDLKREGLLVDSGRRRKTRQGNTACVLVLSAQPALAMRPRRPSRVVIGKALAEVKALLRAAQREQSPELRALTDWLVFRVRG